ncbi:MAG: TIGR03905 family TSCPD domain-containing protein [Ruminococcaceae bacterium]|nr:TIGR03905 family TSCPD domain-containing protein [Oscillospiraceae bacterium]
MEFKTRGTCSRTILLDVEDGIVTACKFIGGCAGNTQGIASLVVGMRVEDVIAKTKGIKCGFKDTSCPDQLAKALEQIEK